MSRMTLQPALHHFRVEMRDACDNPGTIWASVAWCSSHGISRLHVLTNCTTFLLGRVTVMGFSATLLSTTGVPLKKKWPVVPDLEMACFTALATFDLSIMVVAIGSCYTLSACVMVLHTFDLIGMWIGFW